MKAAGRIRLGVLVGAAVAAGIGVGFWWALLRPHPQGSYGEAAGFRDLDLLTGGDAPPDAGELPPGHPG